MVFGLPGLHAGLGTKLQADGVARVSTGYMDSRRRMPSGIINAEGVMHPSQLACILQGRQDPILSTRGAAKLAQEIGVEEVDLRTPESIAARHAQQGKGSNVDRGTIGCVSIDAEGNMLVITSTGGTGNEEPDRVGDSSTVAGTYCTEWVAISCTAFAARIGTRIEDGMSLHDAMDLGIREADERGFVIDAIAVSRSKDEDGGAVSWAAGGTEHAFLWAVRLPDRNVSFRTVIRS
jgi:L-asparaginase